ncbi:MAG TPA: hypothetical protein VKR32_20595 [Puia sp.]|nr:hypothetical protein [Puia sp.]
MKTPRHLGLQKILLLVAIMSAAIFTISCARGITPFEAANGKAKCGSYLK